MRQVSPDSPQTMLHLTQSLRSPNRSLIFSSIYLRIWAIHLLCARSTGNSCLTGTCGRIKSVFEKDYSFCQRRCMSRYAEHTAAARSLLPGWWKSGGALFKNSANTVTKAKILPVLTHWPQMWTAKLCMTYITTVVLRYKPPVRSS